MANDPIQGLIDYVQEIKPYHTKILDVAVAYAHNEPVDLTITEDPVFDITLDMPSEVDEDGVPIRVCDEGWGMYWDRPTPYMVVGSTVGSPSSVVLQGDVSLPFQSGTEFEIRSPNQSPQEVFSYTSTGASYDADDDTTTITVTPSLAGTEFFTTITPPDVTNGDVFIVYTVRAVTSIGSPLGSPVANNNFITVETFDSSEFVYGRQFELRNAADEALNVTYTIVGIQNITPTTLEIVVMDPIGALSQSSPALAQLVFLPDGWDGPDHCNDIPLGWTQTHIHDQLTMEWDFALGGSPLTAGGSPMGSPLTFSSNFEDFQHWILDADSATQEFVVWGDARAIEGMNVDVIHSLAVYGSPYGDPEFNCNNSSDGGYIVTSVTYDSANNQSTVTVAGGSSSIVEDFPSGWIVPPTTYLFVCAPPPSGSPPMGSPPEYFIMVLGNTTAESTGFGAMYTSDSDISTWVGQEWTGGSPLTDAFFPNPTGLVWAESLGMWVATQQGSAPNISYSINDGANWIPAANVDSFQPSSAGRSTAIAWSPSLGLFVVVGNSGKIQRSVDGINWVVSNGTAGSLGIGSPQLPLGSDQINTVTWSEELGYFFCGTTFGRVARSADGQNWRVTATEPGGNTSNDIDCIKAVGTRLFVTLDGTSGTTGGSPSSDDVMFYSDDLGDSWTPVTWAGSEPVAKFNSPGWTTIGAGADLGAIAANDDGSIILTGATISDLSAQVEEYVWRSVDNGVTFTRIPISEAMYGSPIHRLHMHAMIFDSASQLFVLVGGDGVKSINTRYQLILTSPDGLTWTIRLSEELDRGTLGSPVGSPQYVTNEFRVVASKAQN